jgi:predicted amidophosphoribosyltransferase
MKWARLHPVLAAIRARAGNHRLVLCSGCEERTARVGALCRSCAKKWDAGGWDALDFQPPGWRAGSGKHGTGGAT